MGSFNDNGNDELKKLFKDANASKAAFFANSVDTKTSGLDVVVDHKANIGKGMVLKNTLAFTFSETSVEKVKLPAAIDDALLSDTYFDRTSRLYLENSVPNTKGNLSHNLKVNNKFNVYLRNSYFGKVEEATNNIDTGVDRIYAGKTITDLSLGYKMNENLSITIGANNLLDIYPDKSDAAFQSDGRFLYSRRSVQFGTNGRHMFARLVYKL